MISGSNTSVQLTQLGYKNYFRKNKIKVLNGTQDQKTIFDLNLQELKACDLVLAIMDGSDVDSGVAWERGCAFAVGKPVLAVSTDFRQSGETRGAGVNLMLYYGATVYAEEQGGAVETIVIRIWGILEDFQIPPSQSEVEKS